MLNASESKKTQGRELTKKELNIIQLKGNNKPKKLTKAQLAELNINESNTSKLTNAQLQRRRNRQSKKAQRNREMKDMLERLKGMRKKGGVASKMNNIRMTGGKKHKTRKKKKAKKTRKKRGGKRKKRMTAK